MIPLRRHLLLAFLLLLILLPGRSFAIPEAEDFQLISRGSGLTLHKEMFMLPFTYSTEYDGWQTEAVFQVSGKHRLFGTGLYLAYTQISFWQAYDYRNSSPFRDTNYNPEIFYRFSPWSRLSGHMGADLGGEHESNGQLMPLSRSWNLLYAAPWYQRGNMLLYAKIRYRIPEPEKDSPDDPEGDDNPDITDYLGYSDIHLYYRLPGDQMLHATMRGVIGSGGKGNGILSYSIPVPRGEGSFFVVRVSHGYGESLVDYRESRTRVGIGIMLAR